MDLFGFSIERNGKRKSSRSEPLSFVAPERDDGAVNVSGNFYGTFVDFDGNIRNENDLIMKYREMALHAETEMAVDDIINESIVYDEFKSPIDIHLDNLKVNNGIKNKIEEEFENVLTLLDFQNRGYEIFRRWYVDGKLFYHIIIDEQKRNEGIKELRPVDPLHIKKVRKVNKTKDEKTGAILVKGVEEYYLYKERTSMGQNTSNYYSEELNQGLKIDPSAVCFIHSGLYDISKRRVLGYLHKAIKPLNQLRMMEDATVIYRISRAPERRIFYVDVGNLPKNKAEQYLREIMNRYRNKLIYDADSGEIRDSRRHMSMLEDYWMPRREGGRGTEISTLEGGQNLGEMEDVEYFKKKLYQSLHVPTSRLDSESGFNMGRSAEISRDELKFFKFIERLRKKFSELFSEILKTQLILKGVITEEDWKEFSKFINFSYAKDSYFTELKENEMLKERLELLQNVEPFVGTFFSKEYIKKRVLKMTDEDIKQVDKEIEDEAPEPEMIDGSDDISGDIPQ